MKPSTELVNGVTQRIGVPLAALLFEVSRSRVAGWQQGVLMPVKARHQAETLIKCYDMICDVDGNDAALLWIVRGNAEVTAPLELINMLHLLEAIDETNKVVRETNPV